MNFKVILELKKNSNITFLVLSNKVAPKNFFTERKYSASSHSYVLQELQLLHETLLNGTAWHAQKLYKRTTSMCKLQREHTHK